jgi:hypothetical protein
MRLVGAKLVVLLAGVWSDVGPVGAAAPTAHIVAGFSKRDGGPATQAWLDSPRQLLVRPDGSVLIAEQMKVRRVAPDGTISTFAGSDTFASFGDGGQAAAAAISPLGLAALPDGSVLIGDGGNSHRIRRVAPDGTISAFAGSGAYTFPGCTGPCGDGGPATMAELSDPYDIEIGPDGSVYVLTNRVRRIGTDGVIRAFAGNGTYEYSGDGGPATAAGLSASAMTFDGAGNLFLADSGNNRIRKVDTSGVITTVAGTGVAGFSGDGGPASSAQFDSPGELAFAGDGALLVVDSRNLRIRRIDGSGRISTIAGVGGFGVQTDGDGAAAVAAHIGSVSAVRSGPSGSVYLSGPDTVRRIDAAGIITTFAGGGVGDNGPALQATLSSELRVAADAQGNVYAVDRNMNRVRRISPTGIVTTFAGTGKYPVPACPNCGDGGPATAVPLNPQAVALDGAGNVFVALTSQIARITPAGEMSYIAGTGFGCCALGDGGPARNATLNTPQGLAVDRAGNVYVADYGNYRVRKVATDGNISTVAGNGAQGSTGDGGPATAAQLNSPRDVVVDRDGTLYIAEEGRIRRVGIDGIISTFAGDGTDGASGDGGPAVNAHVTPWDMDLDAHGNLLFGDGFGNRIRKIDRAGIITTVAQVDGAFGVAVTRTGAVYVVERNLRRVSRLDGAARPPDAVADFDLDGATDRSVYRPSAGTWYAQPSGGGGISTVYLGTNGDIPVPCDYDGDGRTDEAVFRPAVGGWYVNGQDPTFFGLNGDIPVPGDYDGDGRCDLAIFRPAVGGWYFKNLPTVFYGLSGDVPVPADYDGDGRTDVTVYRPSVGGWYRNGAPTTFFGLNGDIPVPGDYDGNGVSDVAIFRSSVGGWYVNGQPTRFLGAAGDVPVPGDYDGNLVTDVAVYRPATGAWFTATADPVFFGLSNDLPLPLPSAIRMSVSP